MTTSWKAWTSIRFRIHPLFLVVWAMSLLTGYFIEITALFVIVLIHEMGHIWTAISYGWRVEEIELLPFGGVAKVSEYGNVSAREEMIVALAGPLNNGLMVWVAYFFSSLGLWSEPWTDFFIRANIIIGLFNMLPILPLDGGKVFQSLLSLGLPYLTSIRLSIVWSIALSVILLLAGLGLPMMTQPHLNAIVIAIFLVYTNIYLIISLPIQKIRFLLQRQDWSREYADRGGSALPIVVSPDLSVDEVIRSFRRGKYHLIYIVNENGKAQGVISEQRLIDHYLQKGAARKISDLLSR